MNSKILRIMSLALIFASHTAPAQDQDTSAERARIANQRIQAEAERRAQEESAREQARQRTMTESAGQTAPAAQTAAPPTESQSPRAPERAAASTSASTIDKNERPDRGAGVDPDLTRTLEQLRTLGELRDAGYVTEDEFEQLKRRILDGTP